MPRTMHRKLALLAALASLAPAIGRADDVWTDPGAYITLAGVNVFERFQDTGEEFSNSWGFDVRAGYRINAYLAVEGQLEFVNGHEVSVDLTGPPAGTAYLTVDGGNGGVNGRLYAPWLGRLQPYALVGIGGQWARLRTTYPTGWVCSPGFWWCQGTYTKLGSSGAFLAKLGGGAEYWFNEDMAAVIDATFNLPTGDLKDLRSTSLSWGFVFRF